MRCIEILAKPTFSLEELYKFEDVLQREHPNNHNVRAKLRQQLQVLRDKNYLEFLGGGKYQLAQSSPTGGG